MHQRREGGEGRGELRSLPLKRRENGGQKQRLQSPTGQERLAIIHSKGGKEGFRLRDEKKKESSRRRASCLYYGKPSTLARGREGTVALHLSKRRRGGRSEVEMLPFAGLFAMTFSSQ